MRKAPWPASACTNTSQRATSDNHAVDSTPPPHVGETIDARTGAPNCVTKQGRPLAPTKSGPRRSDLLCFSPAGPAPRSSLCALTCWLISIPMCERCTATRQPLSSSNDQRVSACLAAFGCCGESNRSLGVSTLACLGQYLAKAASIVRCVASSQRRFPKALCHLPALSGPETLRGRSPKMRIAPPLRVG